MKPQHDTVQITLPRWEALVLFEWLASIDPVDGRMPVDAAEQKVLWHVEGQLESALPEVVAPAYHELIAAAKQKVLGTC